jgi:Sulfotransferase family
MNPFKSSLWRGLLLISPRLYERQKQKHTSLRYLPAFDATRSIFIHVPKAGGTSISMALYGRNTPHATWAQWCDLNPAKFRSYFKFALIRHPIARFVSAFNFLKSGGMNERDQQVANSLLAPFDHAAELAKAMVDYPLQEQILKWWHFRPQSEFIADELGCSQVDLLVCLEEVDRGFGEILRRLNHAPVSLPHLNKNRYEREVPIDQDASDILLAIYRKDLVLWQEHVCSSGSQKNSGEA